MTETQKYEAKEMAKSNLHSALYDYISAAKEYGYGDAEMTSELEDIIADCDKKWSVLDV